MFPYTIEPLTGLYILIDGLYVPEFAYVCDAEIDEGLSVSLNVVPNKYTLAQIVPEPQLNEPEAVTVEPASTEAYFKLGCAGVDIEMLAIDNEFEVYEPAEGLAPVALTV